jgi:hypothetical protein
MNNWNELPERLRSLFELTGRENTAALFAIAKPIAAGATSTAITTEARRSCAQPFPASPATRSTSSP